MKIAAYGIMLLAMSIGIVPHWTQCNPASGMRCHWTAQASIAIAIPLLLLGLLAALQRDRPAVRALAVVGAALGMAAILLPTVLVGVCMADFMRCNMIMKPALIFAGLITAALSTGMFLLARGPAR